MALIPNIYKDSSPEDGSYNVIGDHTVYGTPNDDRNEVAVFLTAYKIDVSLEETALIVEAFDPETATEFRVTNTVDGRYRYYFIIAPLYNIAIEYKKYDVVYSTVEETFYEYVNDTPSTGSSVTDLSYFKEVTDPTVKIRDVGTEAESDNIVYQVYELINGYNTAKCYALAVIEAAKDCSCNSDCGCDSKCNKALKKIRTLRAVMTVANARQMYMEGEKAARQAEKYCNDCGCLTR